MNNVIIFLEPKGTVLEVIREAKLNNFYVVVISSDDSLFYNAPIPYRSAANLIDEVHTIDSWFDKEIIEIIVKKIKNNKNIVGVYTGLDACVNMATYLKLQLGLPTPSIQAVNNILNKYALRKTLRQHGLSNISHIHGKEADEWMSWQFKHSAYFKPVHGAFSAYVKKCENIAELQFARENWKKGESSDPVFIKNYVTSIPEYHLEEAFEGELLSVESIIQDGHYVCLGLLSRILYSKNPVIEMGSCFPYPHPASKRIINFVKQAHEVLQFTNGATHVEIIIDKDLNIEIIDFNPRFVGADVLQSINFAYGIKIEKLLLDLIVGKKIEFSPIENKFSCLQYILPPKVNEFENIEFPSSDEIKFSTVFFEPGEPVLHHARQTDYLGCYLTVMSSFDEALFHSFELRDKIKINHIFNGEY